MFFANGVDQNPKSNIDHVMFAYIYIYISHNTQINISHALSHM